MPRPLPIEPIRPIRPIDPVVSQKVSKGRTAVDAYRTAHAQLYANGWHKGIPEAHTPLLNTMLKELDKQGYKSIQEFFDASELLNANELGYASIEEFNSKASPTEMTALDRKWQ